MTQVDIAAGIPQEMAEALLAAQLDMPSLRKGERNQYGNYNFVSIDDYLTAIPPVAAKHGLFWITRETDYVVIGEKQNHIAYTFVLDLFHKSGSCLPNYGKITVVHPIQGAQTAGSALAYGEKMLTRFLFKVVTGEGDADQTDGNATRELPKAVQAAPRPRPNLVSGSVGQPAMTHAEAVDRGLIPSTPVVQINPPADIIGGIADGGVKVTEKDGVPIVAAATSPGLWPKVAEVFTTFVPNCTSDKELKTFWSENTGALDGMKAQDLDTYNIVKKAFADRKAEIKKG